MGDIMVHGGRVTIRDEKLSMFYVIKAIASVSDGYHVIG